MEIALSTLLPAPLACCRCELERRHLIPPSNDALRQIIESDPGLVEDLNAYYGDTTLDGGLDKLERELLLDLLANISPAGCGPGPAGWKPPGGSRPRSSGRWPRPDGGSTASPWRRSAATRPGVTPEHAAARRSSRA